MSEKRINKGAAITKLVAWSVVAVILIALLSVLMVFHHGMNFSFSLGVFGADYYEDAHKYSMGNASYDSVIDSIDIDWAVGKIIVTVHDGEEISVEESYLGSNDDDRMRTRIAGDTLMIKYAKSGVRYVNDPPKKTLTVRIPESMAQRGIDLNISAAAADTDVSGSENSRLTLGEVEIEAASGKVNVKNADVREVNIETASGNVELVGCELGDVDLEAVSGKLTLDGEVRTLDMSVVSGNAKITTYKSLPERVNVESVSGSVTLSVPDIKSGFEIDAKTVSGSINSNRGTRYGDGKARFDLESVSGSITVTVRDSGE